MLFRSTDVRKTPPTSSNDVAYVSTNGLWTRLEDSMLRAWGCTECAAEHVFCDDPGAAAIEHTTRTGHRTFSARTHYQRFGPPLDPPTPAEPPSADAR